MGKCLLCQLNDANKTGSHIIPSFLMKHINGNGKRDHEIGFKIENGNIDTYFGRDIYEEKRKNITDNTKKLYSRENYDVKDYIFCENCEKYFSSLENKYATSVNLHFFENVTTENNKVSASDALLFWCSIVWRASVTNHLGYKLKPKIEEILRIALCSNNTDNLNINYALYRCKDYSKNSQNGTLTCMNIDSNHLFLIVNDYVLFMYFDLKEDVVHNTIFGIQYKFNKSNLNNGKQLEKIDCIPCDMYSLISYRIFHEVIKDMKLPYIFNYLYNLVTGKEIPNKLLKEIFELMETKKIGDIYNIENYIKCFIEVLKNNRIIKENNDNTYSVM
ncbi:MAG: hypothetical protein IJA09_06075 [Bacteroidales bacterium]|nr:hypothetical protein [Bacteroidales bacterium]